MTQGPKLTPDIQRMMGKTVTGKSDAAPYMEALRDINKERCLDRMERMRGVMASYGMTCPPKEIHSEFIIEREILGYQSGMHEHYKKKYPKSSFLRDLLDIDTKDKALFRIISFDKAWLFTAFVKERTIRAQEEGDRSFLRRLGEAIAVEPKIKPLRLSPSDNYQRVLDFAEAFLDSQRAESPDMKLPRGILHKLHDLLCKEHKTWFPALFINDEQTFLKSLRRNSITLPKAARKPTKKSSSQAPQKK
ncbi:MAG: hypothetical protein WCJ37_03480 [Syntrophus sp. (in: bacteria)]